MAQHPFHVVLPAVEMDDEIDLAGFPEAFGNEEGHGIVRVMLFGREKFALVGVTFGTFGMGKRSGGELGDD